MIRHLLAFELRFHARQPGTIAAAGILLLLGFAFARSNADSSLDPGSPWLIAYMLGILSLGSGLVAAVLAGNAALRDRDSRMAPIIHATGVTGFELLVSRFAGMLLAIVALYGLAASGMAVALLTGLESQRPVYLQWLDLLRALLILVVPSALVATSLLFSVAVLTRSSAATWVTAVGLYIFYFAGSLLGDSPLMAQADPLAAGDLRLASLLDPYGLIAFLEQTRLWNDARRNTEALPLTGTLLVNRLLWLALASGVFAALVRLYHFRTAGTAPRRGRREVHESFAGSNPWRARPVRTALRVLLWPAAVAHALLAVRGTIFRLPFLVLMMLWSGLVAIDLYETVSRGELGIPLQPTTALIVSVLHEHLANLGWLVVAFFAAEAAWQGRAARMQPVIDATPSAGIAEYLGQLAALVSIIAVLIATASGLGLALQVLVGGQDIDLLRHAGLFYYAGAPLLLFAGTCLLINRVVPNRYLGLLISLSVPVAIAVFSVLTGLNRTILGRTLFPDYRISEMVARPFHADAFHSLALFWTAVVALLVIIVFARRHRQRSRWPAVAGASVCVALALGLGAFVVVRTVPEDPSRFNAASPEWAAAYEHRYGDQAAVAMPAIDAVDLDVELHPKQRRYRVEGEFQLIHRGHGALERVLVGLPVQNQRDGWIEIEGAVLERFDERFGMGWYRFDSPLLPGDTARMRFAVDVRKTGFAKLDPENYVTREAAYVELDKQVPFIGYTGRYEIGGERRRARAGLPAAPASDRLPPGSGDGIALALAISTSAGHMPVSIGEVQSTQVHAQRRTVHYRSSGRVPNRYAVASAAYRKQEMKHGAIVIEQYSHEANATNNEQMLAGAFASLDFHTQAIAPAADAHLRLAVLPSFSDAFGGTSYPGTVFVVENRALQFRPRDEATINPAFTVTAHEVAHQWWGRQLRPVDGPGYRFLTESLATWAELEIVRQRLGEQVADDYRARMRNAYFLFRGAADTPEAPLVAVEEDPATFYFKGVHALHVIGERLGRDQLLAIIRTFFERHAGSKPATPADLVSRIVDAAPPEHVAEIRELLEAVVIYDIAIVSADVQRQPGKGYLLEGVVRADGIQAGTDGSVSTAPVDRVVEIELLDEKGDPIGRRRWLLLQGERTGFRWMVSERPAEIVLDPAGLVLEPDSSDNRYRLPLPPAD